MSESKDLIDKIGKFKDRNRENDFLDWHIFNKNTVVRYSILIMGIFLMLITFYEIFFEYQINTFYSVFFLRLFTLIITCIVFFTVEKISDAKTLTTVVSGYLQAFAIINIIIMVVLNDETIMYQTLTIIIFLQIILYMPNKFINQIIMCLITLSFFTITIIIQTINGVFEIPYSIFVFLLITSGLNIFIVYNYNKAIRIAYLFNNKVINLSDLDTLTKVYHRIKMESIIKYWEGLANRGESEFSIILYDIDELGKINGEKGNGAGDFVLKKVTELLRNIMRRQDIFGRWGDDEFLIILPNANIEKAKSFANRICEKVYSSNHFHQIGDVTISVGVATYKRDEGISSIVNRVSTLVKYAKVKGGNIVITEDKI